MTSITRTPRSIPSVSVLEKFNCSLSAGVGEHNTVQHVYYIVPVLLEDRQFGALKASMKIKWMT